MPHEDLTGLVRRQLRPTETCERCSEFPWVNKDGKLENRILAIVVNTQAGVEEACVFLLKRKGLTATTIQTLLPVYFDFRISAVQTKAVDLKDEKSKQDSKADFTLTLSYDQEEVVMRTDDLMVLQSPLLELKRLHIIAHDNNFYAGGNSHRWVQYYSILNQNSDLDPGMVSSPDEFLQTNNNPLSSYFAQPENEQQNNHSSTAQSSSSLQQISLRAVKENWIDTEMRRRECEFTNHQEVQAFVGTWNVNGKYATESLDPWINHIGVADIDPELYVLCFQELDLSAEAYLVNDGSREDEWTRAIQEVLEKKKLKYQKIISKQLVGLLIVMYAREDQVQFIQGVSAQSAGCGIMGLLGNKGGVAIRIMYRDSQLCFVGSHLAADTSQIERRNQDYQEICRKLAFPVATTSYFSTSLNSSSKGAANGNAGGTGPDGAGGIRKMATLFDCDHVIWAGDLNYRLMLPEDEVKLHLKTNNYETLLLSDQLGLQKGLGKAFADFKEGDINFHPTYKYDVGTDTWDSSEKRRVPAYTDRILWRSREGTIENGVIQHSYKAHMELKMSDHKPVSAHFRLQVKTVLADRQAEVHQAIVRELDKYENECMPDAAISCSNVVFGDIRYLVPEKKTITIENTGQFLAQFRFIPKLSDTRFCQPWLWVNPPVGMIMPGEVVSIQITVLVDNESAPMLNTGKEKLEDILILHLEHGKDYFISVQGNYIRTCFGNSLEWLSQLDKPIRLWKPEEADDQEDLQDGEEDGDNGLVLDLATMVVGGDQAKSPIVEASSSADEKAAGTTDNSLVTDTSAQLAPNPRPKKVSHARNRLNRRSVRQLSMPRDLWRIVDFIYRYGFAAVDNLFMLSGDQATMAYIRECLDTGEEFSLVRLLDKPPALLSSSSAAKATESASMIAPTPTEAAVATDTDSVSIQSTTSTTTVNTTHSTTSSSAATITPRLSMSELKPQIQRPVSIINGIPPKAATFGLGEHMGIHSMAEVLLRFLESLRVPVVPTEMYYRALEVASNRQASFGLLELMPPVHVNVFVYITSFLRELIVVAGGHHGTGNGNANNSNGLSLNETTAAAPSSTSSTTATPVLTKEEEAVQHQQRVAKLAVVFSSAMLRPPPGTDRMSEVEALKRKLFLMHFLQEPTDEDGPHSHPTTTSQAQAQAQQLAQNLVSSTNGGSGGSGGQSVIGGGQGAGGSIGRSGKAKVDEYLMI